MEEETPAIEPLTAQDVADVFNTIGFTKVGLIGAVAMIGLDAQISQRATQITTERTVIDTLRQEAEGRIQTLQGEISALEVRKKRLVAGDLSAA